MVAETKKTDIFASLGLVKAPASLTCLGKVRVGKKFRGVKVGTGPLLPIPPATTEFGLLLFLT